MIILTDKIASPMDSLRLFYIPEGNVKEIIGLNYLDTSETINMVAMFYSMEDLENLDVGHFDTSKVQNMSGMFANNRNLSSLDVSHFDTSNVTDMSIMFSNNTNLSSLDVSHFDTGKVQNMNGMFANNRNLSSLDVSHFDTSNVTNMSRMFTGVSSLTELDVSHFDTSNVTDMTMMFAYNDNLSRLDVTSFNTSQVTSMDMMFMGNKKLEMLDISSFNTSNVTKMNLMFFSTYSLSTIILGDQFKFKSIGVLDAVPKDNQYTGFWQKEGSSWFGTSTDLEKNEPEPMGGVYTWEKVKNVSMTVNYLQLNELGEFTEDPVFEDIETGKKKTPLQKEVKIRSLFSNVAPELEIKHYNLVERVVIDELTSEIIQGDMVPINNFIINYYYQPLNSILIPATLSFGHKNAQKISSDYPIKNNPQPIIISSGFSEVSWSLDVKSDGLFSEGKRLWSDMYFKKSDEIIKITQEGSRLVKDEDKQYYQLPFVSNENDTGLFLTVKNSGKKDPLYTGTIKFSMVSGP